MNKLDAIKERNDALESWLQEGGKVGGDNGFIAHIDRAFLLKLVKAQAKMIKRLTLYSNWDDTQEAEAVAALLSTED